MRSPHSCARDADHLPEVINPEGPTEVPARKQAQAAHPIPFGPDPRMLAGRPGRCADNLTQVIDGVRFTPAVARKSAQIPDARGVFPQNSAVTAMGKAGSPNDQTRIVDRYRFAKVR